LVIVVEMKKLNDHPEPTRLKTKQKKHYDILEGISMYKLLTI